MTQAAFTPPISFEKYLDYCGQTGDRYELVQGELRRMNPPTWLHLKIAKFLEQTFDAEIQRRGYTWEAFRESGQRTEATSSRLPDVIIVPSEAIELMLNQSAVLQVPAILVVEIVSPSSSSDDN